MQNLSIFNKFNFTHTPVGLKFLSDEPSELKRLDKTLDFCEMLKEAQGSRSFYATKDNFTCIGPLVLGMVDTEPIFESGKVGPKLGVLRDPRANRRIYQTIPRVAKGVVNSVAFSQINNIPFEPDILVFTASVSQAEILLRANSYSNGRMWTARGTTVMGCAWLFVFPFLTGELNYTVSGFGFGMKSRKLFPEGMILLSIPWDLLPNIIQNLEEMDWVPESYKITPEEHKKKIKRIVEELKQGK
jgi:uncharacterized protein (DUF169 family)